MKRNSTKTYAYYIDSVVVAYYRDEIKCNAQIQIERNHHHPIQPIFSNSSSSVKPQDTTELFHTHTFAPHTRVCVCMCVRRISSIFFLPPWPSSHRVRMKQRAMMFTCTILSCVCVHICVALVIYAGDSKHRFYIVIAYVSFGIYLGNMYHLPLCKHARVYSVCSVCV